MNILDTKRNIEQAVLLRQNLNISMSIAGLEPQIDGAKISNHVSKDEAEKLFMEFVLNETGIDEKLYRKVFTPLTLISAKSFSSQPYLKQIMIPDTDMSGFKFERIYYEPCEFCVLDEMKMGADLLRKFSVGMFDDLTCSYVLKEGDTVWMSINPMEMKTAEKGIENASGNVLVFGGGLGYYPFMVSLKENVKSVTIIEKDPIVFQILHDLILPQFPNKKVQIVEADAYEYIDNLDPEKYNSVYIDIWPDNVSGFDDYKRFVKYEDDYPSVHFDYWLEDSILDTFVINIYQYFGAKLGTEEYQKYFAIIAPDLWKFMESKHDTISRPEQMDYYLTRKYAKEVLKNL